MEVLQWMAVNSTASQRKVVEHFKCQNRFCISSSTISEWVKNKDIIATMVSNDKYLGKRRRKPVFKHPGVTKTLQIWLEEFVKSGGIVTSELIRKKYMHLCLDSGIENVEAPSNGMIDSIKGRMNIKRRRGGKRKSVNSDSNSTTNSDVNSLTNPSNSTDDDDRTSPHQHVQMQQQYIQTQRFEKQQRLYSQEITNQSSYHLCYPSDNSRSYQHLQLDPNNLSKTTSLTFNQSKLVSNINSPIINTNHSQIKQSVSPHPNDSINTNHYDDTPRYIQNQENIITREK